MSTHRQTRIVGYDSQLTLPLVKPVDKFKENLKMYFFIYFHIFYKIKRQKQADNTEQILETYIRHMTYDGLGYGKSTFLYLIEKYISMSCKDKRDNALCKDLISKFIIPELQKNYSFKIYRNSLDDIFKSHENGKTVDSIKMLKEALESSNPLNETIENLKNYLSQLINKVPNSTPQTADLVKP